jgi:hypothetical protein
MKHPIDSIMVFIYNVFSSIYLARNYKTESTDTVAHCYGYPKKTVSVELDSVL